ncbi:MAG: hydrogenase iron-sulfur subunit [Thermoplasmata archaeon]|nr:MAG: hydrogenase iron-sulfur subunit [Thermoplasmata archaeon]
MAGEASTKPPADSEHHEAQTPPPGEPINLIAFCCNWCSYAGADLAGVSRLQYPPNVKIIRVMCTGRIEPEFLLHAFELGIDGVLVCGCHIGDCHYISGNEKAEVRINTLKKLMDMIGIDSRRLRLEWVSASEGTRFAETVKDFKEQIEKLGKNKIYIAQS